MEIIKNPAFLPYVTNIDNSNLIENDISIFFHLAHICITGKTSFQCLHVSSIYKITVKSLRNLKQKGHLSVTYPT